VAKIALNAVRLPKFEAINGKSWLARTVVVKELQLEMWANAQRDGRPAEYMWRPLFNAAKFG